MTEPYKGYESKASYVEAELINLKDRLDQGQGQGQKAISMLRLMIAWALGLSIVAMGFALIISIVLIGQNEGVNWNSIEIFFYVSLGCIGLGILAPFGFYVAMLFSNPLYI